jgi:hypothetical protein
LYAPSRTSLARSGAGAVYIAASFLEGPEGQINLGLALLQNLSLLPDTRHDIMRCRFMELLPSLLLGARPTPIRRKGLTVVQHLTSSAEHSQTLTAHNLIALLLQVWNRRVTAA